MERPISKGTRYLSGAARFEDLIYLIAKDRGLADQDVAHTRFIAFDRLKFAHMGDRDWNAVAVAVAKIPTEKMVAVGEDGEVFTYVGGSSGEESIQPAPVALRGLGVVDGLPIACGMKRQVYQRVTDGSWTAMHAPEPAGNAGFEAIDGFGVAEVYAVGWNGEIWQWDGAAWTPRRSPTEVILTGVCCAADETVYVCGQDGCLVRGREDVWKTIDTGGVTDDFWDVHWYDGNVYVAAISKLYRLSDSGLAPVDFGADPPGSFYRLSQAEHVLWSVGDSDVFSFDGTSWQRVD